MFLRLVKTANILRQSSQRPTQIIGISQTCHNSSESSNTAVKAQQTTAETASKAKPLVSNRFGKNLIKISTWYMVIIVVGITIFYYAKKDVYQNRVENMKIRKEIATLSTTEDAAKKYPSRLELIRREKNEAKSN